MSAQQEWLVFTKLYKSVYTETTQEVRLDYEIIVQKNEKQQVKWADGCSISVSQLAWMSKAAFSPQHSL